MVTVGYGDFSPAIVEEAVVVSALQILSSIVVAYNISQIGSIILSIDQSNEAINAKIGLLRRMNSENTVSMKLNLVMEEYLIHESTILGQFQYAKHMELIRSMPAQLQAQYYKQAQKNIYRKTPFFMSLSVQTLTKFFLQCQGKVYYPGEYIIKKVFVQQINIVLKGELGCCYRKPQSSLNGSVVEKIDVNYSNDSPLLLARSIFSKNEGAYFDIKATKYSYSIIITAQTFLSILKENQIDYHYYLMALDIHKSQTTFAFKKCEYCRCGLHTKFQCPKLHFIPLKSNVMWKYYEANHTSKSHQKSKFKIQIPRKARATHIYALKYAYNSGNINLKQWSFKKKSESDYLKLFIMSFGDKKVIQNVSNNTLHNIYKGSKIIEMLDEENEMNVSIKDFDRIQDFHHYFPLGNPQKLLQITLRRKKNELDQSVPSVVFRQILVKPLIKSCKSLS